MQEHLHQHQMNVCVQMINVFSSKLKNNALLKGIIYIIQKYVTEVQKLSNFSRIKANYDLIIIQLSLNRYAPMPARLIHTQDGAHWN